MEIVKLIAIVMIFIVFLVKGTLVIEFCLKYIHTRNKIDPVKEQQTPAEVAYGKYIGYAERLLIFVLILTNNLVLISSIIVVKTVVRFEEFKYSKKNHTNFAERYLVGTLVSFLYAIVLSYAFLWLVR